MGCQGCPYHGKKVIVEHLLVEGSDLVVIGESPGEQEEQLGKPFVGPSGQLLERLITEAGGDWSKVSRLNACRCRLDKSNTKEANQALKHCKPHLLRALAKLKPRKTLLLGDIALFQITGKKGISKRRGIPFTIGNARVLATYHPSFLLRRGAVGPESALFRSVVNDIKTLIEGEGEIDFTDYKEGTEADLKELLEAKVLALDTEYVMETKELLCVGFSDRPGRARVFFPHQKKLISRLLKAPMPKVLAARPADEHIFRANGLPDPAGPKIDVLTVAHVLDENMTKYSLEEVANVYTGLRNIKEVAEGMRENLKEASRELIIRYNGVDCDATLQSYLAMKKQLLASKALARYYAKFLMPVQDAFVDISSYGIPISLERLREVEQELIREQRKAELRAIRLIPKSIRQAHAPKVTLTRAALIVDYLFLHPDGRRLKPKKFTPKTKLPSTDEDHLKEFSHVAFVRHLLRWRKISKLLTTYIKNLYQFYRDGRVYPSVHFTRTVTGRTSMSKPSFQNFPKRGDLAPLLRSVIQAPPGWKLGEADLSQSELRIIGWLANDPNILGALREGIDLHTKTASMITGKPIDKITKGERQRAKAVNFGFIYGMSASGFVEYAKNEYGIKLTLREAEEWRARFFSKPNGYYQLPAYHASCIAMARSYGYVVQPLGRRRRLPNINSMDKAERGRAERQAVNFPVQAFSSDLALLAMTLFHQRVKGRDDIFPIAFIHDAIVFLAKEEVIEEAARMCVECMEQEAPAYIEKHFGVKVGYPVEAEAKIGDNLAEMEEIDV